MELMPNAQRAMYVCARGPLDQIDPLCLWWKGMVYSIHQKLTPETEAEGEPERDGESALNSLCISPRGKGMKGSSRSHHVRNHSGLKTASEGILLGVFRSTITVNEDSELAKAFHLIRSI